MEEHLDKILAIIQENESGAYKTASGLADLLRALTAQIYYLTAYKIEYKNEHNRLIYNRAGSVAAANVEAHEKCPGLYKCRYFIKAAENVKTSIIMQISILNKES